MTFVICGAIVEDENELTGYSNIDYIEFQYEVKDVDNLYQAECVFLAKYPDKNKYRIDFEKCYVKLD